MYIWLMYSALCSRPYQHTYIFLHSHFILINNSSHHTANKNAEEQLVPILLTNGNISFSFHPLLCALGSSCVSSLYYFISSHYFFVDIFLAMIISSCSDFCCFAAIVLMLFFVFHLLFSWQLHDVMLITTVSIGCYLGIDHDVWRVPTAC